MEFESSQLFSPETTQVEHVKAMCVSQREETFLACGVKWFEIAKNQNQTHGLERDNLTNEDIAELLAFTFALTLSEAELVASISECQCDAKRISCLKIDRKRVNRATHANSKGEMQALFTENRSLKEYFTLLVSNLTKDDGLLAASRLSEMLWMRGSEGVTREHLDGSFDHKHEWQFCDGTFMNVPTTAECKDIFVALKLRLIAELEEKFSRKNDFALYVLAKHSSEFLDGAIEKVRLAYLDPKSTRRWPGRSTIRSWVEKRAEFDLCEMYRQATPPESPTTTSFMLGEVNVATVTKLDSCQLAKWIVNRFKKRGRNMSSARIAVVRTSLEWSLDNGKESYSLKKEGNAITATPTSHFCLGSMEAGVVNDLNESRICDWLRESLVARKRKLPGAAEVAVIKRGSIWHIRPKDYKESSSQYLIRLEDGNLNAYPSTLIFSLGEADSDKLEDLDAASEMLQKFSKMTETHSVRDSGISGSKYLCPLGVWFRDALRSTGRTLEGRNAAGLFSIQPKVAVIKPASEWLVITRDRFVLKLESGLLNAYSEPRIVRHPSTYLQMLLVHDMLPQPGLLRDVLGHRLHKPPTCFAHMSFKAVRIAVLYHLLGCNLAQIRIALSQGNQTDSRNTVSESINYSWNKYIKPWVTNELLGDEQ